MPNDTCGTAIDLTGMTTYSAVIDTTAFAASGLTIPCGFSPSGPRSAWWIYTNTGSGLAFISFDTGGSDYFNDVSVWTGICGTLTNTLCQSQTYASKSVFLGVSVAPGQTVFVVITDDDAGAGGSLHVAFAASTSSGILVSTDNFNFSFHNPWNMYASATGTFQGAVGTSEIPGAFDRRPSDGHWISARGNDVATITDWGTNFIQGSTFTVNAPVAGGSPPNWDVAFLRYSPDGFCYLMWEGINSNIPHCALQKLNPTTFVVVQLWQDFNADLVGGTAGTDITQGDFSPDGSILYYTTTGSTGALQNNVYKLVLGSGTNTVLATFGTFSGGVNPTGDSFGGNVSLRSFANGNFVVISTHQTAGNLDNASAIIYNPAGSVVTSSALTSWPSFTLPSGVVITDNDTHFWVAGLGTPILDQYNLSITRLIHTTPPAEPDGGDRSLSGLGFFDNAGNIPVPPPTGTIRSQRRLRRFNLPFDGNVNVKIQRLEFLVQSGQGLVSGLGSQPILMCRFSRDGGQTYGPEMQLNTGAMGDYLKRAYVTRGPFGRNLVCEVWDTDPVFSALLDCYVDVLKGSS